MFEKTEQRFRTQERSIKAARQTGWARFCIRASTQEDSVNGIKNRRRLVKLYDQDKEPKPYDWSNEGTEEPKNTKTMSKPLIKPLEYDFRQDPDWASKMQAIREAIEDQVNTPAANRAISRETAVAIKKRREKLGNRPGYTEYALGCIANSHTPGSGTHATHYLAGSSAEEVLAS